MSNFKASKTTLLNPFAAYNMWRITFISKELIFMYLCQKGEFTTTWNFSEMGHGPPWFNFINSFQTHRSQKPKTDWRLDCIFCAFGICVRKSCSLNIDEIDPRSRNYPTYANGFSYTILLNVTETIFLGIIFITFSKIQQGFYPLSSLCQ